MYPSLMYKLSYKVLVKEVQPLLYLPGISVCNSWNMRGKIVTECTTWYHSCPVLDVVESYLLTNADFSVIQINTQTTRAVSSNSGATLCLHSLAIYALKFLQDEHNSVAAVPVGS